MKMNINQQKVNEYNYQANQLKTTYICYLINLAMPIKR